MKKQSIVALSILVLFTSDSWIGALIFADINTAQDSNQNSNLNVPDGNDVVKKPIFGIYLGEKLSEVRNRFKKKKLDLSIIGNAKGECNFEAAKLRMQADDNIREILFKLELLAIDNDTDDTKKHHDRINKLRKNHKFRLEVIEFLGKNNCLSKEAFESILDSQIKSHQMKLEYIKRGIIEAFDEVEQAEQDFFIGIMQTAKEFVQKQNTKRLDDTYLVISQDPNVIETYLVCVKTFKNRVWSMLIYFKDASKQNFEVIEKQLRKKYQFRDESKGFGIDPEQIFYVNLDNIDVAIYLKLEIGLMEENTLVLTYTHIPLFNRVQAEIERCKAENVSGDL